MFCPRYALPAAALTLSLALPLTWVAAPPTPAAALDRAHRDQGHAAIEAGIAYLRSTQNNDGSWSPEYGPAITALCVIPMLDRPDLDASDPQVRKALDYILSCVNEDGSIHNGMLDSYNTSISVSALARVRNDPAIAQVVADALDHLRGLQWQTGMTDPDGNIIDESHPWFGGIGYGTSGRPDMSNVQFMLAAFEDAGVQSYDDAVQRAVVFLNRCQAHDSNDLYDAETIPRDGGMIYSTSVDGDHIGVPESKASPEMIDEGKAGLPVSGLRTYGSITYAGFKSYLYADLDADDPRVTALRDWVAANYTLEQNPGMPEEAKFQGYFYYFMTFAKALNAWGETHITTATGEQRDWANDAIGALADLQKPDGSWVNDRADRWLEGDLNLVTAYALHALTHALD